MIARNVGLLSLSVCVAVLQHKSWAVDSPAAGPHPAAPATATAVKEGETVQQPRQSEDQRLKGPLVKVTIDTSRPDVAGNAAYGLYADVQNIGSDPLTLSPKDLKMVLQPEVAGDINCVPSFVGIFPTETSGSDAQIIIQPNEHYPVFWDVSKNPPGTCQPVTETPPEGWRAWWEAIETPFSYVGSVITDRLSFVPGDYAFVVVGKAYPTPKSGKDSTYHTFTDRVKLHVGLSQIETVFAAMFGGVIGYFVVALRPDGELARFGRNPSTDAATRVKRSFMILRSLFSAALVSAVVTVILSRISDTQFPIKVSVNDFWGALTVGFVAFFVGTNLINRIVGLASSSPGGGSTPTTSQNEPKGQGPNAHAPTLPTPPPAPRVEGSV